MIAQLALSRWSIGESTLVVGPDGTTVLIDAGNDLHAEEVAAAVGDREVSALVATHWHADHVGGIEGLAERVSVATLVSRGETHLDGGASIDEMNDARAAVADHVDLCTESACDLPWRLALGDGAEIVVFAADGRAWDGVEVVDLDVVLPPDDDGENGRSLAGVVRYGAFAYVFGGDLGGGGKGTPDVEGALAAVLPADLVPSRGADLLHLGHHGIDSSTHAAWIDRMLPGDASRRDGIVGATGAYLDAPADEVLDRLRDRLGGGSVHAPTVGSLVDEDDALLHVTGTTIEVRVTASGDVTIR